MAASRPYLNPQAKPNLPNQEKVCTPQKIERSGNTVSVAFLEHGAKVVTGYLLYTKNSGDRDEEWFRNEAQLSDGRLFAELPEGTTDYRLTLIDENNFLVSCPGLAKKRAETTQAR
jgi:hypothetical protein